jgi:glycosyltransferase involved in cell wall biosynthesis/SAM-dependent methyltransferase
MSADNREPTLEWTGERYVPEISGNIRLEHLHRYLLARELCADRRVLDIACGEGYGSDLLARVATFVVGIDIVPDVARHARQRYGRPAVTFAAGTCAAIPLADRSVDVVVSFETLEHHDQHDAMMREVKRVLTPGGVLIISSPDRREYSEIPGYVNPFHTRELDRQEFANLLTAHFQHIRIVGQRVDAGSIVGPLDGTENTAFATFDDSSAIVKEDGLRAPLYLIAVATDGPMPPVPTGLLEGGDFVWSTDHLNAVRTIQEQASQAQIVNDTAVNVLRTEIDRLVVQVAAQAVDKHQADARAIAYQEEVDRRGAHIEQIERARQELQEISDAAHAQLGELRAKLDATEAEREHLAAQTRASATELEGQRATVESLRSERERLKEWTHSLITELDGARTEAGQLKAALAHADVARTGLERELAIIEGSSSWRMTSPLRGSRRFVSRTPALTRKAISDTARAVYRALPLPQSAKAGVKQTIFRSAPWLVRHTVAYRDWVAQQQRLVPADVAPAIAPTPEPSPAPPAPRRFDEIPVEYVPLTTTPGVETRIKTIAFYLPQFHPIPENDKWWGKGFTEWFNVARGRSHFPGHYQPHHPGELGFYDLRLVEIQRRQIELAKMYGLHGFCYHHYWFGGTRLLRRPLDQLLANPDLDFPFCLCWANENWTRRWDGLDAEVLIAQQHSPDDDIAFIRDLEPALRDERYIRVHGRSLLIVYRPALLPDARATAERWRAYCRDAGLPDLFLVAAQGFDHIDPRDFGFDAAVEFAPNNMGAPKITSEVARVNPDFGGTIYDYSYLIEYSRHYQRPDYPLFRTVAPMWDNEARRPGRGAVFAGSTPALYGEWLANACRHTLEASADTPLVFVNAWNEWAEGAHLEPDRDYGYAYLQATAETLRKFPIADARQPIVVVTHDALFYGAQRLAAILAQTLSAPLNYDVHTLACGDGPLLADLARAGRVHDFYSTDVTPADKERIIRDLYARGARIALCNTSVVGDIVHMLKAAGFRVVSMIHELPGLIAQYNLEGSIATIAAQADHVVFPAAVVRDRFTELTGLAPEKAVVRPQGLLAANRFGGPDAGARRDLRATFSLDPTTKIVLAVGSAHLRKGVDIFVDVALMAMRARDDLAFIWVGHKDGDGFEIAHQRVIDAGRQDRIIFPGIMEDIDPLFSGSDLYLMCSREDPFPSVVLHAFDAELPVIGFEDAGGFVELLRRGCGVLVPYLDAQAMADAALRLLDDEAEVRRLTATGKAILASEFGFVDYARDLVQLARGPRVSVIVPNYNYERYLPARLQSILTQRYRPYEIIVLDDCSSDRSVDVAKEMLEGTGIPYRLIRNEVNQGVYRQWLRGLREATGDLVWIAEADDECAPTFLETLVPALANPAVVLAYCQSKQIDSVGREMAPDYLQWTDDVDPVKWRDAYVRRGTDEIRDSLAIKNTIPNVSAVLMRKPDLSEIETTLLNLRNAGDWLVYVHLLERGDVAFVPAALNSHRRHGGSVTIGHGGVNLMREILFVQRYVLARHAVAADVERKRDASLQATYEYLGLHTQGPATYKDHPALGSLTALAG